jgi:acyl carrier protein
VLGLNENNSSLSLVVEISEGLNSLSAKELLNEIESNLNSLNQNCAIEKIYYTYDPIAAKTAVKVSRSILKKWIASGDVKLFDYNELKTKANANDEEIVNEIALKVKEIMAEVLSIDLSKINVKSHYIFDLGGSSLGYISLLMKLKENFGVDFNTANEKGLYNAEQFANYIMEKKGVKTDE